MIESNVESEGCETYYEASATSRFLDMRGEHGAVRKKLDTYTSKLSTCDDFYFGFTLPTQFDIFRVFVVFENTKHIHAS